MQRPYNGWRTTSEAMRKKERVMFSAYALWFALHGVRWCGYDGPDEDAAVGGDHVALPRKLEFLGQEAAARHAADLDVVEDVEHPKRADHEFHEQPHGHDLAREIDVVLAHGLWECGRT